MFGHSYDTVLLREGIYVVAMHEYQQAMMILFEQELLSSCGPSLIPPDGLSAVIFANRRLLLPTKFVVVYVRKKSRSTISKWVKEERGWFQYAGDFPTGWEKKVKVTNLFVPVKKSSAPRSAKPKSAKKGDDSSETCSDIVPFKGVLPPIGNIALESSLPSTHTHSSRRPIVGKSRPTASRPSVDAPPSSRT